MTARVSKIHAQIHNISTGSKYKLQPNLAKVQTGMIKQYRPRSQPTIWHQIRGYTIFTYPAFYRHQQVVKWSIASSTDLELRFLQRQSISRTSRAMVKVLIITTADTW